MPYSRTQAIAFWEEFDRKTIPEAGGDLLADVHSIWSKSEGQPEVFQRDISGLREEEQQALVWLAEFQLSIMSSHFNEDEEAEQRAFEDFGQGVLFNAERPPGNRIHMMDGDRPTAYRRWHSFIRAVVVLGVDQERWLWINRLVGLAWAIQSLAKPKQDKPDNPPLEKHRLKLLRAKWLMMTERELDYQFRSHPYPPEAETEIPSHAAAEIAILRARRHPEPEHQAMSDDQSQQDEESLIYGETPVIETPAGENSLVSLLFASSVRAIDPPGWARIYVQPSTMHFFGEDNWLIHLVQQERGSTIVRTYQLRDVGVAFLMSPAFLRSVDNRRSTFDEWHEWRDHWSSIRYLGGGAVLQVLLEMAEGDDTRAYGIVYVKEDARAQVEATFPMPANEARSWMQPWTHSPRSLSCCPDPPWHCGPHFCAAPS